MKTRFRLRRMTSRAIRTIPTVVLLALFGTMLLAPLTPAQAQAPVCPWMDTSKSPEQRAQLLFDAMTLDQKLRWLNEHNAMVPEPDLCFPGFRFTDGPQGVRGETGVTAFPAPIARAATWDTGLSYLKGQMQADEAFRKLSNVVLAPGVNLARVPYNGRNFEYFGEDPFLMGQLAVAEIKGLQEGNPDKRVVSTIKHYVANNQEENRRNINVNVDERTLRQIYLPAYEMAVKDAQVGAFMCSFNKVNGIYMCENPTLLTDVLKDEWGFEGYVVSDFRSNHSTVPSALAGLDMELFRPRYYAVDVVKAAIESGELSESVVDELVRRVVVTFFRFGVWDHPLPPAKEDNVSTPEHRALARQLAAEGSVLLKNEDEILPLGDHEMTIAVIGPTASEPGATDVCQGGGSAQVTCDPVTPLDGIIARAAQDGDTVTFDDGSDLDSAAATAADADVAIVFGYYTESEGRDIEDLSLDNNGDALISAVAAANPNTIVVLNTGGPVLMPWLDQVKGVIEVWYPGVEMGNALADVLFSDVNPSGRLPQTFPKSEADLPTAGNPLQYPGVDNEQWYSEGLLVGYRWFDQQGIDPLFPFGYGLSYTTFEYSHLQVTPVRVQADKEIRVHFRVTNTGSRTGTEVAQVYLGFPAGLGEPPKRLVGWAKVTLEPGEHENVMVRIDPISSAHPLSYWDTSTNNWATASGEYKVYVGSSSRDLLLTDTVNVH